MGPSRYLTPRTMASCTPVGYRANPHGFRIWEATGMSRVYYYRLKYIQIPIGILFWWWHWGNPLRDPAVSDLVKSTTKSSSSSPKQDSASCIPTSHFYPLPFVLFVQHSWSVRILPHGDTVSQWGRNDSVPWMINKDPETAFWMGPRFLKDEHKVSSFPERLLIVINSTTL